MWRRNPFSPPRHPNRSTHSRVIKKRTSLLVYIKLCHLYLLTESLWSLVNVAKVHQRYFSRFRCHVCWYCHRTGAARSRSRRLHSGFVQEKMLLNVSSDHSDDTVASFSLLLKMLMMMDVVGDGECLVFAGSTESQTRWTTGWWITRPLTGEQRSAYRNVQSIIRQFRFSIIRLTFIQ